jgi:hypothetical protein
MLVATEVMRMIVVVIMGLLAHASIMRIYKGPA